MSPLVEIGLTDLPKSGGAMAPPAPPGTTPLYVILTYLRVRFRVEIGFFWATFFVHSNSRKFYSVDKFFSSPIKKIHIFFFNIQDVKCACDDGGLVHPWDCCSVGSCNVFCCNCGGPCRNNETSLDKGDFAMFEEQRSKRSVMTIDHEEYNVSYNEYSTGA